MSRTLGRVFFSISTLLVTIAATLFWLGFTSSGLRIVLSQVPGLSIEGEVSGGLLATPRIRGLSLDNSGVQLTIDEVELDWRPLSLLNGVLDIESIELVGLSGVSSSEQGDAGNQGATLKLPFAIEVGKLQGTELAWQHDSQNAWHLDSVTLVAALEQSLLTLSHLNIAWDDRFLAASGAVDISMRQDGSVQLEFSHSLPAIAPLDAPLNGSGSVQGTWESLQYIHSSVAPFTAQTKGTINRVLATDRQWLHVSTLQDFRIPSQKNTSVTGVISSDGNALSNTTAADILVDVDSDQFDIVVEAALQQGRLNLNRLQISLVEKDGETEILTAQGYVDDVAQLISAPRDASRQGKIAINGRWQHLNALSSLLQQEVPEAEGEFTLHGTPLQYVYTLNATTETESFKTVVAEVVGSGSWLQLTTDSITVKGTGLDINGVAKFSLIDKIVKVDASNIRGNLSGKPVSGRATVSLIEAGIDIEALSLNVAGSSLNAQGNLGKTSNLSWTLKSNNLHNLYTGLEGILNSSGTLTGAMDRPVINAKISGERLRLGSWEIDSISGNLAFGLAQRSPWNGTLNLYQVAYSETPWVDSLQLDLSGTLERHSAKLQAIFADQAKSHFDWQGQYNGHTLIFNGEIDQFPARANRIFTPRATMDIEGNLNVLFDGRYTLGEHLSLNSKLNSANLSLQSKTREQQRLSLSDVEVSLTAKDAVRMELSATVEERHRVAGFLAVAAPLLSADIANSTLSGQLNTQYDNLASLQALLPENISVNGNLAIDASVAGTLQSPQLSINTDLAEGDFSLTEQGIRLHDIEFTIESMAQNQFKLSGTAIAGEGPVAIDGTVDLANLQHSVARVTVAAENAQLMRNKSVEAFGDVNMRLHLDGNTLNIEGDVVVKNADIRVGQSSQAVGESPDLVLQEEDVKDESVMLNLNLAIDLGSNTLISASGLTGRLQGMPTIRLDRRGLLTSVGEVRVMDGKFAIGGEELTIDSGSASYSGGAISNPNLLFEASKQIGDIRAGISISGNADAPQVSLFSQPSYPDQDILALVFFGKTMDQLGTSDAFKLARIAAALKGGSFDSRMDDLNRGIARYLGVEKIDVSVNSNGNQQSIDLSSQINSRLDIGYAYNVVSALQALFLKYKINERWSIQSDIDVESGADIHYRIERD